jgi:hypothetical protein
MHAHDIHVLPTLPPRQGIATVIECEPGLVRLDDGRERFAARRATSCLVDPQAGDRVWFVSETEHFVIAVLDRPNSGATLLSVTGDVELRATGKLALRSEELEIEARSGRLMLERCAAWLGKLQASMRESSVVGRLLELVVDRVTQVSKQSVRSIAELDHVQAGAIDYRAQESLHVHAKHALVRAEQLVKMDADQIHLG